MLRDWKEGSVASQVILSSASESTPQPGIQSASHPNLGKNYSGVMLSITRYTPIIRLPTKSTRAAAMTITSNSAQRSNTRHNTVPEGTSIPPNQLNSPQERNGKEANIFIPHSIIKKTIDTAPVEDADPPTNEKSSNINPRGRPDLKRWKSLLNDLPPEETWIGNITRTSGPKQCTAFAWRVKRDPVGLLNFGWLENFSIHRWKWWKQITGVLNLLQAPRPGVKWELVWALKVCWRMPGNLWLLADISISVKKDFVDPMVRIMPEDERKAKVVSLLN